MPFPMYHVKGYRHPYIITGGGNFGDSVMMVADRFFHSKDIIFPLRIFRSETLRLVQ